MASEEPCRHCGCHEIAHEPAVRRGHEYEPPSWPLVATCARCGREARLWPYGLMCPMCSGILEAIEGDRLPWGERRQAGTDIG